MGIGSLLRFLAIAGNILFIPWMLYAGLHEGFRASAYQLMSDVDLTLLLVLNGSLACGPDKKT